MSGSDDLFAGLKLDRERIQRILYEEFNNFQENFELKEESQRQTSRGAFLGWFMVFGTELFPGDLADEIATYVEDSVGFSSHSTFGWHNTLDLRAGLFALTGDPEWIDEPLQNLGHETSSLRVYVAAALAPIAPLLSAANETLMERIAFNYTSRHFFNSFGLLLFAAAKGDSAAKQRQLRAWQKEFDPESDSYDTIGSLLGGAWIENPFVSYFRRTERYMLLRLCATQEFIPPQLIGDRRVVSSALPSIDAAQILSRVKSHPLTGESAKFEELGPVVRVRA
ncbi:MAG: hypothetical protein ACR2NS_11585 [Gemmatimonadaceae bacterium]